MQPVKLCTAAALALAAGAATARAAPVVFSAADAGAAGIQAVVDDFRAALGTLNPNNPGSVGSGRREINWDGVPDDLSSPNAFPGDFFNANAGGRARGAEFSTPGSGFEVSAGPASGVPLRFGNIDASYPGLFAAFSEPRLFTATSSVTDATFLVPGSSTAALTQGFGAVFADVDLANTSGIEFFDAGGSSLGTFYAPAAQGDGTLSFLGVRFTEGAVVSRVRVTAGTTALGGPETPGTDLVVFDDFIYGEPIAAPSRNPAASRCPAPASSPSGCTAGHAAARDRRASGDFTPGPGVPEP